MPAAAPCSAATTGTAPWQGLQARSPLQRVGPLPLPPTRFQMHSGCCCAAYGCQLALDLGGAIAIAPATHLAHVQVVLSSSSNGLRSNSWECLDRGQRGRRSLQRLGANICNLCREPAGRQNSAFPATPGANANTFTFAATRRPRHGLACSTAKSIFRVKPGRTHSCCRVADQLHPRNTSTLAAIAQAMRLRRSRGELHCVVRGIATCCTAASSVTVVMKPPQVCHNGYVNMSFNMVIGCW